MGYQLMQPFNVTQLPLEQHEKLLHKLPNYSMVSNDSLKEHIHQIDEDCLYSIPTLLTILTMVLSILIGIIGTVKFCYYK